MKPEAADYLGKTRQCLDDAKQIAAMMPLHHIVAREGLPCRLSRCRSVHIRAHRQDHENASRLAQRVQPAGAQRTTH